MTTEQPKNPDPLNIKETVEGWLVHFQAREHNVVIILLVLLLIVAGVVLGQSSGVSTTRSEWAVAVATECRANQKAEADRIAVKEAVTQIFLVKLIAIMEAEGLDPPELPNQQLPEE